MMTFPGCCSDSFMLILTHWSFHTSCSHSHLLMLARWNAYRAHTGVWTVADIHEHNTDNHLS